jgi:ketosteroid isomerase-like protein
MAFGGPHGRGVVQHGGKDEVSHGTYITVWQQQPDGSWRFVWDAGEQAKERK